MVCKVPDRKLKQAEEKLCGTRSAGRNKVSSVLRNIAHGTCSLSRYTVTLT